MPDIESLKRQIECIKREIVGYEKVRDVSSTEISINKSNEIIATLREVLATLEQLGSHDPGDVIPPAPKRG